MHSNIQQAESLIEQSLNGRTFSDDDTAERAMLAAQAQVYATLALVEAVQSVKVAG